MKHPICSFAVRVIAAATSAVQNGTLTNIDIQTIARMAEALAKESPEKQTAMLAELAKELGVSFGDSSSTPARARVSARRDIRRAEVSRQVLVARGGELDAETKRSLARAFGDVEEDAHGEYSGSGVRTLADGRIQLSAIALARSLRRA